MPYGRSCGFRSDRRVPLPGEFRHGLLASAGQDPGRKTVAGHWTRSRHRVRRKALDVISVKPSFIFHEASGWLPSRLVDDQGHAASQKVARGLAGIDFDQVHGKTDV